MRINVSTSEYDCGFNIGKMNYIFSYNGGGKSSLCKLLKDGFDGKLTKKFLIDGNVIEKTGYSVFLINDIDTIDVEKSLSAKSILKGKIAKQMIDVDDEINLMFDEYISRLKEEIKNNVFNRMSIDHLNLRLDFELNDLISKFSVISDEEKRIEQMSFSEKRMAYIDLVINEIRESNKPSILIVDEIDLNLSDKSFDQLMKCLFDLSDNTDSIVFVSSSKVYKKDINKIYTDKFCVTNDLFDDETLFSMIADEEKCNVEDVKNYYLKDELKRYIEQNDIIYKLELKFLNTCTKVDDLR